MKKTRILLLMVFCILFAGAGCGKPIVLEQKVTLPFIPVMSGQQFPLPPNAPVGYAFTNESIPYVVNASKLPTQDALNAMVAQQLQAVLLKQDLLTFLRQICLQVAAVLQFQV